MVKIKVLHETKEQKFRRIAEARVNKILLQLSILQNCANPSNYEYSDSQVNHIFRAIEEELKITKAAFQVKRNRRRGIKL